MSSKISAVVSVMPKRLAMGMNATSARLSGQSKPSGQEAGVLVYSSLAGSPCKRNRSFSNAQAIS